MPLLFIVLLMNFVQIYEIASTEVLSTNQECPMKDTSHPPPLKAIMKLEYLRKKSKLKNGILALRDKHAEYCFYQQEFFRNCLVKQSELNPKTKVDYFGKRFVGGDYMGSYLKTYEYFCKDKTNSILKKHCDRVLRYSKVSWFNTFESNAEQPKCVRCLVRLEYAYEGYYTQRMLLKCPGVVQVQGVDNQHSGIFISLADDPRFNKSVAFVFSPVGDKMSLKMVALLINQEPFAA